MRFDWLADLLAVMDHHSLNRAAEKRFISQPAFSRRMRAIEDYFGVELLDRSRKPIQAKPQLEDQKEKIRDLVNSLNELVQDLQQQDKEARDRLIIASQHAITTALTPRLIARTLASVDANIRIKDANRDECLAMLMTRRADVMLVYSTEGETLSGSAQFLETRVIGNEALLPVCASSHLNRFQSELKAGAISIVAYPSDAYLGGIMQREILPPLRRMATIRKNTEISLTTASLQCAIEGIGIAWVPESLALPNFNSGELERLDTLLPSVHLSLTAARLQGEQSPLEELFWKIATSEKAELKHQDGRNVVQA